MEVNLELNKRQREESTSSLPQSSSGALREFRCISCNKLLGKYALRGGRLQMEVFCRRCRLVRQLQEPYRASGN
jgi:phage FluMu protein Com